MIWLIMRRYTRAPVKFILFLLVICAIAIILDYFRHILTKHNIRPHYLEVVEGDHGEILAYNRLDRMISHKKSLPGRNSHIVLCVDAYLSRAFFSKFRLTFPICIHDPEEDLYISRSIFHGELYEQDYIMILMDYLADNPELGLLDIGANLGVFTLAAAHMNRKVVSVEALPASILRLRSSIEIGGRQKLVKVIHGAVSNVHDELYAMVIKGKQNLGGATMVEKLGCLAPDCDIKQPIKTLFLDDLVDFIPFKKGVMKIDIEGYELKAFQKASKLLDTIEFSVIMMEWRLYGHFIYVPSMWEPVQNMIKFFTDRDYIPCNVFTSQALPLQQWEKWPMQVLWRKSYTFNK